MHNIFKTAQKAETPIEILDVSKTSELTDEEEDVHFLLPKAGFSGRYKSRYYSGLLSPETEIAIIKDVLSYIPPEDKKLWMNPTASDYEKGISWEVSHLKHVLVGKVPVERVPHGVRLQLMSFIWDKTLSGKNLSVKSKKYIKDEFSKVSKARARSRAKLN